MSHIPILTRKTLTAPVTYYVRKDGSDINTGLSNDAAGAFLTVQAAVDLVAGALDMGNYQVTIQVGNGTYTEALSLKSYLGIMPPILQGSVATPSNVVLTYSSGASVVACSGTGNHWTVRGFKVSSTGTCADGVLVDQNAIVNFYEMDFGTCISAQVNAQRGGIAQFLGNYTISGGAAYHINAATNGCIQGAGRTVTLSGTPAFSNAFLACEAGSSAQLTAFTFSGAATGVRYRSGSNSTINVGAGDETYFPGNAEGVRSTGGVYNAFSAGADGLTGSELAVTGATTATIGRWHRCTGTTADYTLTLPPVSGNAGKQLGVIMDAALTKLVTLDGDGTETIDDELTRIMWAKEVAILRVNDAGTAWEKVGGKTIPMTAEIHRTGNQTFNANVYTKLLNTTQGEAPSVASMVDTANARIYIRRTGKYTIHHDLFWNNTNSSVSTRADNTLYVNGSGVGFDPGGSYLAASQHLPNVASQVATLTAGSYLEQWACYSSGSYSTSAHIDHHIRVVETPSW